MKSLFGSNSPSFRRGLSIIELMIAITISLIVLVVMMQAFRRASGEIKKGRAMIEMASEMRAVGETFRRDMAGATVSPRLWNLNSESNGYFEIVEGPDNDATYMNNAAMSFFGDIDDVIALTVRSGEKPFRGRWVDAGGNTQIVESHVAEIIWFVVHENVDDAIVAPGTAVDMDDRVTLYRRVLLVRPDLAITEVAANIDTYYLNNDISARPVGANLVANTLADLTLRENRYAHSTAGFPYAIQGSSLTARLLLTGEDIALTNVGGFDLRAYSPNGPAKTPNDSQFLGPNDPNYTTNTDPAITEGSYVDLGWSGNATGTSWFEEVSAIGSPSTWDSWSPHYEYNGIDDDGDGLTDEGTNGLDDDGDMLVDEEDEQEAPAPYAHPLRGVQLTMRGIEKSTRNIRQVTITSSFVPE